jgi:hypothetical protein
MSLIDPLQALATVGFRATKSRTFPLTSIDAGAPQVFQLLMKQTFHHRNSYVYGSKWES